MPPMTRRELGSVYTPQAIARSIVRASLGGWFGAQQSCANEETVPACRVLDPACGDGAFLLEVFDELCRRYDGHARGMGGAGHDHQPELTSAIRLGLVRDHIFGTDI